MPIEKYLLKRREHPYIGQKGDADSPRAREIVAALNEGRGPMSGEHIDVTYYMEPHTLDRPFAGLEKSVRAIIEHGTVGHWLSESSDANQPDDFEDNMAWVKRVEFLGANEAEGVEAGLATVAYPLAFFDRTGDGSFPLAQMFMAFASEPYSAFTFYEGSKVVDVRWPASLAARFPERRWPHRRVREYLNIGPDEPIIGTIVKPKTGLPPEMFARSVLEAAQAGARFVKADENHHLTPPQLVEIVRATVQALKADGFDLSDAPEPMGPRILFAPHITTDPLRQVEIFEAAVDAGANAVMYSPHYAGGYAVLAEMQRRRDVPIYAHTAGMNVSAGCAVYGIDPRVHYALAARFGAAFMQLPAMNGYIKPTDAEKPAIIARLKDEGLEGPDGMTLVIAGGLGAKNIGLNMRELGVEGRMFLAGTSVYAHPLGVQAGVKALILAHRACQEEALTEPADLKRWADALGDEGKPLSAAL